ncbi:uncharacterized protein EV420DRAFT_1484914 [Desarmillaria tabescens]|uniref:Uncharacterized protein n=1 Tax=Armillaria tabescens TaxID=1929756 RepID=A0AA39JJ19_ARMTA|nr:uncharacterized protein EV420DRAFT_1484914 [Desarmillaria tabescens]KAK0443695.1 hypothetical protein EV420DRAFT_1484914 [Desarmillaria tabescens]
MPEIELDAPFKQKDNVTQMDNQSLERKTVALLYMLGIPQAPSSETDDKRLRKAGSMRKERGSMVVVRGEEHIPAVSGILASSCRIGMSVGMMLRLRIWTSMSLMTWKMPSSSLADVEVEFVWFYNHHHRATSESHLAFHQSSTMESSVSCYPMTGSVSLRFLQHASPDAFFDLKQTVDRPVCAGPVNGGGVVLERISVIGDRKKVCSLQDFLYTRDNLHLPSERRGQRRTMTGRKRNDCTAGIILPVLILCVMLSNSHRIRNVFWGIWHTQSGTIEYKHFVGSVEIPHRGEDLFRNDGLSVFQMSHLDTLDGLVQHITDAAPSTTLPILTNTHLLACDFNRVTRTAVKHFSLQLSHGILYLKPEPHEDASKDIQKHYDLVLYNCRKAREDLFPAIEMDLMDIEPLLLTDIRGSYGLEPLLRFIKRILGYWSTRIDLLDDIHDIIHSVLSSLQAVVTYLDYIEQFARFVYGRFVDKDWVDRHRGRSDLHWCLHQTKESVFKVAFALPLHLWPLGYRPAYALSALFH